MANNAVAIHLVINSHCGGVIESETAFSYETKGDRSLVLTKYRNHVMQQIHETSKQRTCAILLGLLKNRIAKVSNPIALPTIQTTWLHSIGTTSQSRSSHSRTSSPVAQMRYPRASTHEPRLRQSHSPENPRSGPCTS